MHGNMPHASFQLPVEMGAPTYLAADTNQQQGKVIKQASEV